MTSAAEPGHASNRPPLPARARVLLPLLLLALAAATLHLYGRPAPRPFVEFRGEALGTTFSVKLAEAELSAEDQRQLDELIRGRLAKVDALMSTWKPDSELSRFNRHAATTPFPLSEETAAVFRIAQAVAERSGGALDVTVAPLVDAWGFGSAGPAEPPPPDQLRRLRERVGFRKLALLPDGSLHKRDPALACDLSAVAKGYAVDEVARGLSERGHQRFLVEVGGELRARGSHLDGRPWRVAIETPDVVAGRRVHRVVVLDDLAMATSGDYRNYYERDGQRFSHTLDPRTGRPISHGLASVTVLHPEAAWADAWATALNVLGPEAGPALAEREGLAAYFIVRRPGNEAAGFGIEVTAGFEPHLVAARPG